MVVAKNVVGEGGLQWERRIAVATEEGRLGAQVHRNRRHDKDFFLEKGGMGGWLGGGGKVTITDKKCMKCLKGVYKNSRCRNRKMLTKQGENM